ncbi:carbohydrate porin [Leisingera sp. XS_AS12]|uniref:carbohydrate porin n=1 Tax=Leisingera sp. XS_AS12 TaxID=3241294 RepID=UPI0035187832
MSEDLKSSSRPVTFLPPSRRCGPQPFPANVDSPADPSAGLCFDQKDALQGQITSEIYYRFQLLETVAVTPSVQFITNQKANPSKITVTVLGLRLRATF